MPIGMRDWAHRSEPLRAVRRHLKPLVTGQGAEAMLRLRNRVKALELEAEQIELADLAERLATLGRAGTEEPSALARTLGAVVAFYSHSSPGEADHAAIETISRAVTDYAARHPAAD
jgi:hypothetical protein